MILSPTFFNRLHIFIIIIVICIILYLVQLRSICIEEHKKMLITFHDDSENNVSYDFYVDMKCRDEIDTISSILNMKQEIKEINEIQKVFNEGRFGPVGKYAHVIVAQIHDNIIYLESFIESLRKVNGINKSLLIFSHDHYDEDINEYVRAINFASYMQIFYPYTYQLHPKKFPGEDKHFCTDGFQCKMSNGERKPVLVQKKQHWWWQVNQVFDRLKAMQLYNNNVIFLKEDQLVAEDLLHVLKMMEYIKTEKCPECELISLGAYLPFPSQCQGKESFYSIETWSPDLNNTGIVFNRTVWEIIKSLSKHFCYFNDYRWEHSLQYATTFTHRAKFSMLIIEGPRVFQIAKCNSYTGSEMDAKIQKVKSFIRKIKKGLYPNVLKLKNQNDVVHNVTAGGEFTDVRDREICLYVSKERNNLIM